MLPFVRAPGIIPADLEGPLFDPESGNEWVVVRAFVPGQTVRFPVAPLECPDPSSGLSLLQGTPAEDVDEVRNPFSAVAQGLRRSFPGILRAGAKRLCPGDPAIRARLSSLRKTRGTSDHLLYCSGK
ncbi:hypothetical protein [Leptospirillum ferriphilum]|uniref:hypothetical protein n=1 Tax=Leptospirillum ferriphilum TaxID=178606 RepID=UPI00098412EF|nr:hypothetical protein [Leptospirillum ferriphilum]OOH82155.1 hypothetical protein BOX30_04030 [Leptospirillum ferriphilum]